MEENNVEKEFNINPSLQSEFFFKSKNKKWRKNNETKFENIAQSKEIVETKWKKCFVLIIFLYKW
jgi:hypothetical protein